MWSNIGNTLIGIQNIQTLYKYGNYILLRNEFITIKNKEGTEDIKILKVTW